MRAGRVGQPRTRQRPGTRVVARPWRVSDPRVWVFHPQARPTIEGTSQEQPKETRKSADGGKTGAGEAKGSSEDSVGDAVKEGAPSRKTPNVASDAQTNVATAKDKESSKASAATKHSLLPSTKSKLSGAEPTTQSSSNSKDPQKKEPAKKTMQSRKIPINSTQTSQKSKPQPTHPPVTTSALQLLMPTLTCGAHGEGSASSNCQTSPNIPPRRTQASHRNELLASMMTRGAIGGGGATQPTSPTWRSYMSLMNSQTNVAVASDEALSAHKVDLSQGEVPQPVFQVHSVQADPDGVPGHVHNAQALVSEGQILEARQCPSLAGLAPHRSL
ncbi:hypothetical protein INR49_013588 [Caranx melampygus]|nr:hypothetical protein INR49_013588 [Caranx melampygus]